MLFLRALRDGPHLGAAVFLRRRLVLEKRLHLLLAIDEQGLDLALLIGGQAEFLVICASCRSGFMRMPRPLRDPGLTLIRGWGRGVLGDGGAGYAEGEQAAQGEGKEFVSHNC